jgi:uncharacterized protein with ParB-like and HNH nuclease domain
MSDKFLMDPRVSFVTQILDEIEYGTIKVPRFQRELVWNWDQQRELLCSIVEGIPIGSILVWSTKLTNVTSYSSIGPFALKNTTIDKNIIEQKMYLMDGLQRMSTLYSLLKHPIESANKDDLSEYEVYADLKATNVSDMFLKAKEIYKEGKDPNSYQYLPMKYIYNSKAYLKFQRTIPLENENLIDRADDILMAFKNYKVPMIPMISDNQELVTKSFERINTRGTHMSETHMLNALSYSPNFELLESLNKFKKEYLSIFEYHNEIDQTFILQLAKLQLGYSIYGKNTDKIAKEINDVVLEKIFIGIKTFLEFTIKTHGISKISSYPYKLQAIGVCFAFINYPSISEKTIKSWINVTAYTGAFGATARHSESALTDFITYLKSGVFSWTLKITPAVNIWRDNTNIRSTRFKLWMAAQALKQEEVLSNDMYFNYQKFKGKYLKKPLDIPLKSKKSGYYFLQENNFSLKDLSPEKRDALFINSSMVRHINDEKWDEFREERENVIFNWELNNIFMPSAEVLNFSDYVVNS